MATEKQTVKVCDICKKKVAAESTMYIGGHPHAGWYAIEKHGGPTNLEALREQKQWDVCSEYCLQKLSKQLVS